MSSEIQRHAPYERPRGQGDAFFCDRNRITGYDSVDVTTWIDVTGVKNFLRMRISILEFIFCLGQQMCR